jgi:thiol-disulfide isomerase/thioredoxin
LPSTPSSTRGSEPQPANGATRPPRRRVLLVAFVAVLVLAVAGVIAVAVQSSSGSGRSAEPGTSAPPPPRGGVNRGALAPDFQLTTLDGDTVRLSSFRGRPVVVNFWASWCGPCVKEMPALSAMQRDYEKKGITFIGLGVDSEKNVNDFLKKVPVGYPVYVTGFGGAELARSFGNKAGGLPFTVVIDANGQVRSTKLGEVDPKELKHTLDSL